MLKTPETSRQAQEEASRKMPTIRKTPATKR
jgi:hypothetical protein